MLRRLLFRISLLLIVSSCAGPAGTLAGDRALVSAHRCGGGIAPEGTGAALECSAQAGPDLFEFDLRLTSDDVLVLIHDATPLRMTDCAELFGTENVYVSQLTLAQIKQLTVDPDSGNPGLKMLTLEEALDYLESAGDFGYLIECKDRGGHGCHAADVLCDAISSRGLEKKVCICSFDDEVMSHVEDRYPDFNRCASYKETRRFALAANLRLPFFRPSYDMVALPFNEYASERFWRPGRKSIVQYAHRHGIAVAYWTINKSSDIEYLVGIGADVIMTDYPQLMTQSSTFSR